MSKFKAGQYVWRYAFHTACGSFCAGAQQVLIAEAYPGGVYLVAGDRVLENDLYATKSDALTQAVRNLRTIMFKGD